MNPEFNETFTLKNIAKDLKADDEVTFQAFDEDVAAADFLGQTKPFPFLKFCQTESPKDFQLDLFNKKEKAGTLFLRAKYNFADAAGGPGP